MHFDSGVLLPDVFLVTPLIVKRLDDLLHLRPRCTCHFFCNLVQCSMDITCHTTRITTHIKETTLLL